MNIQDERALIDMHSQYFDILVKWCRNYVGYDSELRHYAEDWAQEAFYRAIKDKTKFATHENKIGWLINTCKHIVDNELRRRGVRNKHMMFSIDSPDAPSIEDMAMRIEKWEDQEEAKATIQKVISVLTKNEMDVFNGYFLEKTPQDDTARQLGKSEEAVKATIRRIRGKVKNVLSFLE